MMREIIPADELLHKAQAVGQYYGFTPLSALTLKARGQRKNTGYPEALNNLGLDQNAETVVSFLRQCQNIERAP